LLLILPCKLIFGLFEVVFVEELPEVFNGLLEFAMIEEFLSTMICCFENYLS